MLAAQVMSLKPKAEQIFHSCWRRQHADLLAVLPCISQTFRSGAEHDPTQSVMMCYSAVQNCFDSFRLTRVLDFHFQTNQTCLFTSVYKTGADDTRVRNKNDCSPLFRCRPLHLNALVNKLAINIDRCRTWLFTLNWWYPLASACDTQSHSNVWLIENG